MNTMQALVQKEQQLNEDLLHFAESGNTEKCEMAIANGAYIHTTVGWLGCTPLILACMNGHKETAIVLIDQYGAGNSLTFVLTSIHICSQKQTHFKTY